MSASIYSLSSMDLQGNLFNFSTLEGKVILIVNIASKCGFTPQLEGLEKLYQKYKDQGLVIIGFPCNQFLFQEPLEGKNIQDFCSLRYGVSFPIMQKTKVIGLSKNAVYKFLTKKNENGVLSQHVWWNFYKFLLNKKGEVVQVFSSTIAPFDKDLIAQIESAIAK